MRRTGSLADAQDPLRAIEALRTAIDGAAGQSPHPVPALPRSTYRGPVAFAPT